MLIRGMTLFAVLESLHAAYHV